MKRKLKSKSKITLWDLLRLERRLGPDYNLANDLYEMPLVDMGYMPTSGHVCLSVEIKKGSVK